MQIFPRLAYKIACFCKQKRHQSQVKITIADATVTLQAKREKFNLQADRQIEKTHFNERRNYILQNKEVKQKLFPLTFIYV